VPSDAKAPVADVCDVTCAKATGLACAKTSDATPAEATDVTSTKAADVASTEATHMASTEATHVASAKAATVSSTAAAAAAAAGLCTRGNKAAGKQCARQDHHCSSSHNILHLDGRTFRRGALSDVGVFQQGERQCRDGLEIGMAILRLH
jgi:hypothetical protein